MSQKTQNLSVRQKLSWIVLPVNTNQNDIYEIIKSSNELSTIVLSWFK